MATPTSLLRAVRPKIAPAAGLAAMLLSVAACGGGGAHPIAARTSGAAGSGTASGSSGVDPSASSASSAYASVLPYVHLTAPGTRVPLGQGVDAAWTPAPGSTGVVRIRVDRVVQTTAAAALRAFRLTADQRTSTPYFVHVRVANLGPEDLSRVVVPIYVRDSAGDLVQSTAVEDSFTACAPHALPAPFAAGAETRGCLIFLLPQGTTYDAVEFVPPTGVAPLVWTGPVHRAGSGKARKG